MHPSMQVDPSKRTTVQLQVWQDPWPMITGWGQHHKLTSLGTPQEGLMVFQGGWGKPHNVAFHLEGNVLTIQAWVRFSFGQRMQSFFILPAEINISSGARGALGRRQLRTKVNELLGHLGAPPIQ